MLTVSLCEVSLLGRKTEKLQISHEGLNHVAIRNGRIQLKREPFKSLREQRFKEGQEGWSDEGQRRCWMLKLRAGWNSMTLGLLWAQMRLETGAW